jgi:hypothetical protein
MELLLGLHHAHSEIGWPPLRASEQGIGLFSTEDAQQAGIPKCSRHINCEFYRLNVNLRPLVRPMPLKIYGR